jgi:hypothetical protein
MGEILATVIRRHPAERVARPPSLPRAGMSTRPHRPSVSARQPEAGPVRGRRSKRFGNGDANGCCRSRPRQSRLPAGPPGPESPAAKSPALSPPLTRQFDLVHLPKDGVRVCGQRLQLSGSDPHGDSDRPAFRPVDAGATLAELEQVMALIDSVAGRLDGVQLSGLVNDCQFANLKLARASLAGVKSFVHGMQTYAAQQQQMEVAAATTTPATTVQ